MIKFIGALDKKLLRGFSVGFLIISSIFVYIGVQNLAEPKDLVEDTDIINKIMFDCEVSAKELMFQDVKVVNRGERRTVTIQEKVVKDPMDLVYKTSILKSACNKLTMKDYCLGEECRRSNKDESIQFKMTLKLESK